MKLKGAKRHSLAPLRRFVASVRYHLQLLSKLKCCISFHKDQWFDFLWRQIRVVHVFRLSFSWMSDALIGGLPKDLIILLISNYFKDKWVHLASQANLSVMNTGGCAILASHWRLTGWRSNLFFMLQILTELPLVHLHAAAREGCYGTSSAATCYAVVVNFIGLTLREGLPGATQHVCNTSVRLAQLFAAVIIHCCELWPWTHPHCAEWGLCSALSCCRCWINSCLKFH